MTPERWKRVRALFGAALGLQPGERSSFLDEGCGDDKALRREVDSLLAAGSEAGSFLAAGAQNDAARMLLDGDQKLISLVGNRLDHYQVRRYDAWYRHVTLCLVAGAYLAVARSVE